MGQKVNPIGFRLGINKKWLSTWFCKKKYASWLDKDKQIRLEINKKLKKAGIAKIEIERATKRCKVIIHAARPGLIIGKKGAGIEKLKADFKKNLKGDISLNVQEVKKIEINAQLIALNIAKQLEKRVAFRRAMKKAILAAQKCGIKGIRVACSGRLGGVEMSRKEWYREGRVPLHTIRANIDYGFMEANMTYGKIGCKVWLFSGEVLPEKIVNKNNR